MNWLALQTMMRTAARISVERVVNALPEGLLIAFFAWALLRGLRKQNSGTRFAVCFLALLTVAMLPLLGGGEGRTLLAPGTSMSWGHLHPAITVPASWALLAFVAWVLGTCVGMVRLAAGLWRLRQLRRSCTAIVAADLDPVVQETLKALHRSESITIATSKEMRVPSVIGFWRRTIILPAWALRELPAHDLSVILRHEFAHLRRGDDWTNLIQKIVRAIFFFHPAVWWIESRLSVEREMACDDAVLAETANPHGYAKCLVSLLEKTLAHRLSDGHQADKRWSMAQAAVNRAREAALRLARILDTNRPVAARISKPALAMVGVFSVICLAVLPYAPQFVAFDRGLRADSDPAYTAAVRQPASQSLPFASGEPRVVPRRSTTRPHAVAARQFAPVPAIAVRWNAEPPPTQMVRAGASADHELVPQFQTLVFIQATEYMTVDVPVWSVQVWRVTFVAAVPERLMKVPVASSI